jgi:acyl carrier protein
LARLFRDKLNLDPPPDGTDLIDSGWLDSLTIVELLARIEEEFETKISIEELEIDHFRSLDHLSSFLERHPAVAANAGDGG